MKNLCTDANGQECGFKTSLWLNDDKFFVVDTTNNLSFVNSQGEQFQEFQALLMGRWWDSRVTCLWQRFIGHPLPIWTIPAKMRHNKGKSLMTARRSSSSPNFERHNILALQLTSGVSQALFMSISMISIKRSTPLNDWMHLLKKRSSQSKRNQG